MNNVEILTNVLFVISSGTFLGMCFWTMYNLGKDHKKSRKIKKA